MAAKNGWNADKSNRASNAFTGNRPGAGIDSDKWLLLHELVKIETGLLPPIYAKVRWRDHPRYGVIFEQTFQLENLARICNGLPAPAEGSARAHRSA